MVGKAEALLARRDNVAAAGGQDMQPFGDGIGLADVLQTTVTAAHVSQAANAPILPIDLLHAMQQSGTIVGRDTGAANACTISWSRPSPG